MKNDKRTYKILECAYNVHPALELGLLESAYEECFTYELLQSNLKVERQKALPLIYWWKTQL
jgi:GxxExxY protein